MIRRSEIATASQFLTNFDYTAFSWKWKAPATKWYQFPCRSRL